MDTIFLFYILSTAILIGTFIPISTSKHWFIRGQTNFKVEYLIINLVLVIAYFSIGSSWGLFGFGIMHFIGVLYCFKIIYPYLAISNTTIKKAKKKDKPFKLLIHNVYQYNEKYNNLIQQVKEENPDVILLLETGKDWEKGTKDLYIDYPYVVKQIKENTYGIIMLSNIEPVNSEIKEFVSKEIPSAEMLFSIYDKKVRVLGIHPKPPIPGEALTSLPKEKEFKSSAKYLNTKPDEELNILIGDFNDVAWSRTAKQFKKVTGMKDPRKGRGFYSTFPTYSPIKIPLDHVFVSEEFSLIEIKTLPHIGSDHLPILVTFQVP